MTKIPFLLEKGERVHETVPVEDATTLVSDGNSRWEEHDGTLYFVVNESYKAPEE